MELDYLAAQYVLGGLPTDDLKERAYAAIVSGHESPHLAALAGAERALTPADLRDVFEAALRELGIELPNRMQAGLVMKRQYARQVVIGELPPREGARLIVGLLHQFEGELPKVRHYVGDNFGIAQVVGSYYGYDDIPDYEPSYSKWVQDLDESIVASCARIARGEDANP